MFDLEESLRQWRREIEATLAFSADEIDELEDHLRFSVEAKVRDGVPPNEAWMQSLGGLGSASALALEFAKDKLMPALRRLFVAWWRAAVLFVLFVATAYCCTEQRAEEDAFARYGDQIPYVKFPYVWVMAGGSFLVTLLLLPKNAQRNAALVGVGNAFGLIPILHVLFYNGATEKIIGQDWTGMAASFGWMPVALGLICVVMVNVWFWRTEPREKNLLLLAAAGALALVLAFSPFVGELIGNLSIREIFHMPVAADVPNPEHSGFLQWKFVDVMVTSVVYIVNFLPFALVLLVCAMILLGHGLTRGRARTVSVHDEAFPSANHLPWIMAPAGSGFCWMAGHIVEPPFSDQLYKVQESVSHAVVSLGYFEVVVLLSAAVFFICSWELTRRLARATTVRPFYASALIVVQLGLAVGLLFPEMGEFIGWESSLPHSFQPIWLTWALQAALLGIVFLQIRFLSRNLRNCRGVISLWRFDGGNLVELGFSLGLILACCWLPIFGVANVMAFESVTVIHAMIDWGNSVKDPATHHFYPQIYGTPDHLMFWMVFGMSYLCFCLSVGLGVVLVLSALEFIRFNCFRLYRLRRIRAESARDLALND